MPLAKMPILRPLIVAFALLSGGTLAAEQPVRCGDAWYRSVEKRLGTGDGLGHGPDVGSQEWKSVVEFRLGIRSLDTVPDPTGEAWCGYIERAIADGPAFSCTEVENGGIETLICREKMLSGLDRTLAYVYATALRQAEQNGPQRAALLEAQQREWIVERNACQKSNDETVCLRDAYRKRIAGLQAVYALVKPSGTQRFTCDGIVPGNLETTFYVTQPPTLLATYGGRTALLYLTRSASGSKYENGHETFWEHHGEAMLVWRDDTAGVTCKAQKE